MHQLGDQWIEIIDGKVHMVKAVKIIGKKNLCLGCVFHTGSHADCCDTEEIQCFEEGNEFIVKDLGILKDGCLSAPWDATLYPHIGIYQGKWSCCAKGDGIIMRTVGDTEQQAKDSWNRRA